MKNLPLRALAAIALVAIFGSILYYAVPVTVLGLLVVVIAAIGIAAMIPIEKEASDHNDEGHGVGLFSASGRISFLLFTFVISLAAWWNVILHTSITTAVRSPWSVVNPFALVAFGVAVLCYMALLSHTKVQNNHLLSVLFPFAILFSALAMAAVIYPLGFGFDPFLHRATVTHIVEYGTIHPKPLYYIGQYAIELVLAMVGHIPLNLVDRFLLPVFASFAIVTSLVHSQKSKTAYFVILFLPLGAFITTTPQGVAYVFALCAILLSRLPQPANKFPLLIPLTLAVASTITHPIAGIPVLLYVVTNEILRHIPDHHTALRNLTLICSGITAACAIPLLFAVQSVRSGLSLSFNAAHFFDITRWKNLGLTSFFSNHFSTWYDGLYLVIDNILLIVIVLAIIGYAISRKRGQVLLLLILPIIFSGAMFVSFLILNIGFDFDFLISYERSDYAVRALTLIHLFLLPLVAIALDVITTIRQRPLRITAYILLTLIGMANVYGAYPRHDSYARSAGFNVSIADFDAVAAIAAAGGDDDFIVLANQATSAAAVEAYGFKKYYHDNIFYYPIPTGGVLYEKFLTMVNDAPTRKTMIEAMDIAGIDRAFFAVSDYWWKSEEIIENAKREADDWFSVDNGAVTVFKFRAK